MKGYKTLDDFDVSGKTVLVRIDINTSLDDSGVPQMSERIAVAGETLKELSDRGARTVVLAHQGRAGDEEFASLETHARLLSQSTGMEIRFIDDIFGPAARRTISELDDGDTLLLENVRFLAEETLNLGPEEHSKSFMVRKLSPLIDIFVNDAFSAAHRSQASLVGFAVDLPKALGRTMEREVSSLSKAMEDPEKPCAYILGGLKPEEAFKVMAHGLESGGIDKAMTCGVIGRICLIAGGVDTGPEDRKFFVKKGFMDFLPTAKDLVGSYEDRVVMPADVAALDSGKRVEIDVEDLPTDLEIFDIGSKTIEAYRKLISEARTIVMNGPAGVYEDSNFRKGTEGILEAIAESDGFSLMGGGHTLGAMEKLGFPKERFSYVSLAGGALISYLGGEKMPALEAMRA
jgi:phosphoglycerate kinase